MTIAQHLSKTNEHYTPANIVEGARVLMGGIDLDPASCLVANETVKATRIYDVADDGLSKPWHGRVFLNPPGGRLKYTDNGWVPVKAGKAESSMRVWWQHLCAQWTSGKVLQAFFVAFTLEILRTSQRGTPAQKFFRCYPKDRLCFGGDDPTHANVLIYLPAPWLGDRKESQFERFRNIFSEIGYCEPGSLA